MRHTYIYIVFACLFGVAPFHAAGVEQSALSQGKWVKVSIGETGVYKLSHNELRGMGFSQPARVAVYGYGGWALEEDLSSYVDDLPPAPVVRGNDYILFYGRGTVKWAYDDADGFQHTQNPYATTAYYFLTEVASEADVPVVPVEPAANVNTTLTVTAYDDYLLHEVESNAVNESGRELFGEYLDGSRPLSLPFDIPGLLDDEAKVSLRFISRPTGSAGTLSLAIDGTQVLTPVSIPAVTVAETKAREVSRNLSWQGAKTSAFTATLSYTASTHTNSYLDYLRFQVKRRLQPYGACTLVRSIASINQSALFRIAEATANTIVLDVTDANHPRQMTASLSGAELSFSIPAGALREFAIIRTDQSFPTPVAVSEVANQNLHALQKVDMVILVPPLKALKIQAERLAEAHRKRDGLRVEVVEATAVYNEFSSGTPDATAYRRFLKMFYDRNAEAADKPKYLLLFGDGIFDNRALSRFAATFANGAAYQRLLLTYQSQETILSSSYVTDDYFACLNDANHSSNKDIAQWALDIGVGRLPVRTESEATQVVDKLIAYMENGLTGVWKNNVCFVADDGNNSDNFTTIHTNQSNQLAGYLEDSHPEFLVNKVFFDAYKKDFSSVQNPYPDVRNRIQKLLKNGLLLINYTGHGSNNYWSDEKVMSNTDIAQSNYPCLPLWITATCDFTPFDAPSTSAGEMVILSKSGGIALYTTTRLVYREPNFIINNQLIRHLFGRRQDGTRLTFGEVMRETKNSAELYGDDNKLNFIFVGDPAMKLAYPEYGIRLTAFNGEPLPDEPFTLKALDRVTLEGEILSPDGTRATGFNGDINPTIFDCMDTLVTLDNNKTGEFTYTDYPSVLFAGNDVVTDGVFSFSFIVPKDISYSGDAFGKMNFYASDRLTGNEAQGAYLNFKVGGTSETAGNDIEGPEIRALYLNDSTFAFGGKVNTAPLFIASLWDASGVNITGSSIGHDMSLIIDGNPSLSYVLNDYYQTLPGANGEGRALFSIPTLSPGIHNAEFIVWDVYNNSSRQSFTFEAVEGLKPTLYALNLTPNPASTQVQFSLAHNRPETTVTVHITVYDMSGRLLWQHEERGSSEAFRDYIVTWDLTTNGGAHLRPGIYICRASIATAHTKEAARANKLVILAQ